MKNFECAERFSAAVVATLGIAYYDYLAGPNISLWVAYVAPITIAGLACGRAAAVSLAILGSTAFVLVDQLAGHPYPTAFDFAFAAASRILVLVVVAVLVSDIRRLRLQIKEPEENHRGLAA